MLINQLIEINIFSVKANLSAIILIILIMQIFYKRINKKNVYFFFKKNYLIVTSLFLSRLFSRQLNSLYELREFRLVRRPKFDLKDAPLR